MKQSISLISANKQMVTGGFRVGQAAVHHRCRDCPNLVLHKTDWLAYNGRKYAIENYEEYEFDAAYIIPARNCWASRLAAGRRDPQAGDAWPLVPRRKGRCAMPANPNWAAGFSHP